MKLTIKMRLMKEKKVESSRSEKVSGHQKISQKSMRASPIIAAKGTASHTRVRSGPIIWCARCGAYAMKMARNIAGACIPGKGKHGKVRQLARLMRGLPPKDDRLKGLVLPPPEPLDPECPLYDEVRAAYKKRGDGKEATHVSRESI